MKEKDRIGAALAASEQDMAGVSGKGSGGLCGQKQRDRSREEGSPERGKDREETLVKLSVDTRI